jgi:hypothetical protein
MSPKTIYILVEGEDDKRFFETLIKQKLESRYRKVSIQRYAHLKAKEIEKLLNSIINAENHYIFVADFDKDICLTARKKAICANFPMIDMGFIMIVVQEIESWYLAGLDDISCEKLSIRPIVNCNDLCKGAFNKLYEKKFTSKIDFVQELLKNYSLFTALKKNDSFRYFYDKFIK